MLKLLVKFGVWHFGGKKIKPPSTKILKNTKEFA